jgi:hypothetical protein
MRHLPRNCKGPRARSVCFSPYEERHKGFGLLLSNLRPCGYLVLLATVLLTACGAPETVTVTVEITREVEVTVLVPEESSAAQPETASTPYPTYTPYPTHTPLPTLTPPPTDTLEPSSEPTATPQVEPTEPPVEAPSAPSSQPISGGPPAGEPGRRVELIRIPEGGPRPPFTLSTSTIRIEEDGKYKLTGTVRNDGSETYEAITVDCTFYDEHDHRFGPIAVHSPCMFLEPGAECPFSLEINPQKFVSYLLGVTGRPVENRQPAAVVLSGVGVSHDGIGNARISGALVNGNGFPVKDVTIAGTLIDTNGEIVSVGSTLVLDEIAPGASRAFDLRIEYKPYSRYQLYAQAVQG